MTATVQFNSLANGISHRIHRAFGYVVFEYTLAKGATIEMDSSGGTREESENRTLWTRGLLEITNQNNRDDTRYRHAGDFSQELPDLRAGKFDETAIEEASWWCINSKTNNGKLPMLIPFRLEENKMSELNMGNKLLICHGTLVINNVEKNKGSLIKITSADKITVFAKTQVFGLLFL